MHPRRRKAPAYNGRLSNERIYRLRVQPKAKAMDIVELRVLPSRAVERRTFEENRGLLKHVIPVIIKICEPYGVVIIWIYKILHDM